MSAVALNENKVFILFSVGATLRGVVCIISGTSISVGSISSSIGYNNAVPNMSITALSENAVFITYANSANYYLYGVVCTISETSISVGTGTKLSSTAHYHGRKQFAVTLSQNKVVVIHTNTYSSSNINLNGIVCNISGTTISVGSTITLLSTYMTDVNDVTYSVKALSESSIFIAYNNKSNTSLNGVVCIISGTTIKKQTVTQLSSEYKYSLSIASLSKNKICLICLNSTSLIHGIVCNISGTTISVGSSIQLSSNTANRLSIATLSKNDVIVIGKSSSDLYAFFCKIDELNITVSTEIPIISNGGNPTGYYSVVALSENKTIIANNFLDSNQYLYGTLFSDFFDKYIKKITLSTEKIGGIAITSGQAGETVSIKKPNVK